jgi:hypothetical protein
MRVPELLAVLVLSLLILSGIPLRAAYATSCSSSPAPIETVFKASSFVFTGIPERDGGGPMPFKVTHVYKPPEGGLPKNAQVLVSFAPFGGGFKSGKEYVIFGFHTKVNGSTVSTLISTCVNPLSADARMAELRDRKQDPNLFSKTEPAVIFIGRVTHKQEWLDTRLKLDPPIPRALVDFEVVEIFRNYSRTTRPAPALKESQRLRVFTCGNAYQVGHQYVVFAEHRTPGHFSGAPSFDGVHYTSQCEAGGSVDLNEKAILQRLSKKHQR